MSTDMTTIGAGTGIPPAVGLCSTGWAGPVVAPAPSTAPLQGTGLPATGTPVPVRLRGLIAAAGTAGSSTGALLGAPVRPFVQTTALRGSAVVGAPVEHLSTTPGDLPPEDPLS